MEDVERESYEFKIRFINTTAICGLSLAVAGVIIQIVWFVKDKKIRRKDQKILLQLSIASLINMYINESGPWNLPYRDLKVFQIIYGAIYAETDMVTLALMFVFTYHLYEKVLNVFVHKNCSATKQSLYIWIVPLPFAIICSVLMVFPIIDCYAYICTPYYVMKYTVLVINVNFFIVIIKTAINRNEMKSNLQIIKVCIVSMLIIITIGVQSVLFAIAFLTNSNRNTSIILSCFVFETFYVVAVTVIFMIISKNTK